MAFSLHTKNAIKSEADNLLNEVRNGVLTIENIKDFLEKSVLEDEFEMAACYQLVIQGYERAIQNS